MLQIENKLELFENVVYKRRMLDLDKRKEVWEEERKDLLKKKSEVLGAEKTRIVKRREDLARIQGNEQIAKAREDERVLRLKKLNQLEEDFVEAIRARVGEYTHTPAYGEDLMKDIDASLAELPPGEFRIGLVQADTDRYLDEILARAEEKGFTLKPFVLEDYRIGGHTISDIERTYSFNSDLYTKIEEKRYEIGKLLYRLFREELDYV